MSSPFTRQTAALRKANRAAIDLKLKSYKAPAGAPQKPLHKKPPPDTTVTFTPAQLAAQAAKMAPEWLTAFMSQSQEVVGDLPLGRRTISQSRLNSINRIYHPGCCGS